MKLRAPAVPLITVDPYFSVWSNRDCLYDSNTVHWTGAANTIGGLIIIDGEPFRFMGNDKQYPIIRQVSLDFTALTTEYQFRNEKVQLYVTFFTPLFPEDLYRLSRPVSYLCLKYESVDGQAHDVKIKINLSEELCLNHRGDDAVTVIDGETPGARKFIRMGSESQKMLTRCGDDLRIEWGYVYLCCDSDSTVLSEKKEEGTFIAAEFSLQENAPCFTAFAYDDIYCLEYFGKPIEAYWKKKGISIEQAIDEALDESESLLALCQKKSEELFQKAEQAGGEKYAELLSLAFRQLIAAHKLAVTPEGENIFISKECFSNGCTATVDVTYPSSPFFLLYNTELLKGMLRPIFTFAQGDVWEFDFAPHDVGTYPLVNGQKYGSARKTKEEYLQAQMPVEECGNMIIMMANIAKVDGNTEFCDRYMPTLEQWVKYLITYGEDPANQLCTDDFAGHLAHNCNLSLKAIMGIMGYSEILKMQGNDSYQAYRDIAEKMAKSWVERAANEDCSFRLAFDQSGTFSMKYNVVWDKIWGTGLFSPYVLYSEFANNCKHINIYGMPLDNRKAYTKSDWLVWTACLAPTKKEFEQFIEPLWNAYHFTTSRVPMTDWYDTFTASRVGFQNRTVQGGLFIKLLMK